MSWLQVETLLLTNIFNQCLAGVSAEVNAVTDVNLVASIQQLSLISTLRNQLEGLTEKQEDQVPAIQPLKVGTDSGVECDQQNSTDRCCGSTDCLNLSHSFPGLSILTASQLCPLKCC